MEKCEQCGQEAPWRFSVTIDGRTHVFDSFECAIFAVAPACSHCGCRILGHPIVDGDEFYCCQHCVHHHRSALEADPGGV